MSKHLLVAAALCLASCGGDDKPAGAVAQFEPPAEGPLSFADAPFPNPLFWGQDGTFDLADPIGAPDIVVELLKALDDREAYCRSCAISFPIVGELDPASVPGDAPVGQDASVNDKVLLMRADGQGEPIRLRVEYSRFDSSLVIRPASGVLLAPETEYVAAITNEILSDNGVPLAPSSSLRAAMKPSGGNASVQRVREGIGDALERLESAGVARDRIAAVTRFTTDKAEKELTKIKTVADAAPAPTATFERIYRDSEGDLDVLMGVPSVDRVGADVPPAKGQEGNTSIVHDAIDFVVKGTFNGPRIVEGSGTEVGALRRNSDGSLDGGSETETIPFVLLVPKNADLSSLPVIFVHHGTPSNKREALRIGNTFARMGMAVFSIDAFQMGARAESAADNVNQFRDLSEPDGFFEENGLNASLRVAGFSATPLRIDYGYAAFAQNALDASMGIRLLREGNFSAIQTADAALQNLAFDASQVYWFGNSFGAFTGMNTLPIAGGIQAAMLLVGPSDGVEHLCQGPENRAMAGSFVTLAALIGPFDEVDQRMCMNSVMSLASWLLEPVSAQNSIWQLLNAPLLESEPPDLFFMYSTFDELLGVVGEQVLGALEVPTTGRTATVSLPALTTPASANRVTPNGTITVGGWIHEADHSLHRVLNTTVAHEFPLLAPFTELAEPRAHENPIEDVHFQMRRFIETRMQNGRATIVAPE